MPDLYDETPDGPPSPEKLCLQAFSRCSNWPTDRAGQLGLAQGLKLASDQAGVSMQEIVRECASASVFCPTDRDLESVARAIRDRNRPSSKPPWLRPEKCHVCHDSGWRQFRRRGDDGVLIDCSERCPGGCAVPEPAGRYLTPEVLR